MLLTLRYLMRKPTFSFQIDTKLFYSSRKDGGIVRYRNHKMKTDFSWVNRMSTVESGLLPEQSIIMRSTQKRHFASRRYRH